MVSRILHLVIVDVLSTALALRIGGASLAPDLKRVKDNLKLRRVDSSL
jgi:RpiR family carbohydrate utilization transcriptional regulator